MYKKRMFVLIFAAVLLLAACGKGRESDVADKPSDGTENEAEWNTEQGNESQGESDTESGTAPESGASTENEAGPEQEADTEPDAESESEPEQQIPEPELYTGTTDDLETVWTTALVNVRVQPSLEAPVYAKLANRTEVQRIRDEGEWSAVYYDGYQLYIASEYLRRKTDSAAGQTGEAQSYVIVIDPGHQDHANTEKEPNGPGSSEMKNKVSGGTRGTTTGLPEYKLTLQVSEKLRDELVARGYTVIMTRESHDVDISNSERAMIANENAADAFIRIHANGSENPDTNGVMTICQTASNPYNSDWYEESKALSQYVLDEVAAATGARKQYVWETDTMTGINWAQVPSTILEMGYMTNPAEDKLMASEDYQYTIAEAVADAIDLFARRQSEGRAN